MKRILDFSKFINEKLSVNEDGYGNQPFFFAKNGDTSNYFFKIETADKHRALVLSIGKFSQFAQPTEAKTAYGVLGIIEVTEDELEQAIIDKGKYEINDKIIDVDQEFLKKIFDIAALCVADYLQKNPKIGRFYDEMQATIHSSFYMDEFNLFVGKWPGSTNTWHVQEVEKQKLITVSK